MAIAQIGLSYNQYHEKAINSLIYAFCKSETFDAANASIEILSNYDQFTSAQLKKVISAIENNRQVREAYGLSQFKKFLHSQYDIIID